MRVLLSVIVGFLVILGSSHIARAEDSVCNRTLQVSQALEVATQLPCHKINLDDLASLRKLDLHSRSIVS